MKQSQGARLKERESERERERERERCRERERERLFVLVHKMSVCVAVHWRVPPLQCTGS